ncbi:MAG TPA: hypothetical protein VN520_06655 [Streptomyces sp.]|uniref:hypothetical protein n=1 Tax=Streptomyces sp. TaxID=1931 RepID=UPI002C9BC361|nr:hypothetical protein [Streptomyces sp.]HWU06060.1 hypothetical protein [Streptomyces sp.]
MTHGTVWIYTEGYREGNSAARLLRADKANEIFQLDAAAVLVNGTDTVWNPRTPPSRPEDLPPQFLIALAKAVQTARRASGDGYDRVVTARHSASDGWRWHVCRLEEIPDPPQPDPLPPALTAATRAAWGIRLPAEPEAGSPAV